MQYENYLTEIIVGSSSAFTAWFFARRKNKIEVDANEIENLDRAVAMWRTIAEDLKKENEERSLREKELRKEILELKKRISDLEEKLIHEL